MSHKHLHLDQEFFENQPPTEINYLQLGQDEGSRNEYHHNGEGDLPPGTNKFYQEYRRIYSVSHHLQGEKERLGQMIA